MTRLNDHQLIQRVDDDIVLIDESRGEEVLIPARRVENFRSAVEYLVDACATSEEEHRQDCGPTLQVHGDQSKIEVVDLSAGEDVAVPSEDWQLLIDALRYLSGAEQ